MLYWQYGQAKAVRMGDWKLVQYGKADWELYDLEKDRTELNNLAAKHPERVQHMAALWEKGMAQCKK